MNNYEKIRQACIKANPKLLELSFGCEVVYNLRLPFEKYLTKGLKGKFINEIKGEVFTAIRDGELDYYITDLVEILGHEPQLSDVLLAIGQQWREDFNVGINGNILNMGFVKESTQCGVEPWAIIISYDLSKPVKDQSEETLQFLADLL